MIFNRTYYAKQNRQQDRAVAAGEIATSSGLQPVSQVCLANKIKKYLDYILNCFIFVPQLKRNSMDIQIKELNIHHEGNRGGEPKLYHDKMYVWINNQTIIDNLMGRGYEPYKDYKKFVIPKVMEAIKEQHPDKYELLKNVKWSWNKNCGCSMCPCSPGFVSDRKDFSTHQTIHITI